MRSVVLLREEWSVVHPLCRLSDLVRVSAELDPVFLRCSEGPAHDTAWLEREHRAGRSIAALTARPLTPPVHWDHARADWIALQLVECRALSEHSCDFAWALHGRGLDVDADGLARVDLIEPLAPVSRTLLDEALRRVEQGGLSISSSIAERTG